MFVFRVFLWTLRLHFSLSRWNFSGRLSKKFNPCPNLIKKNFLRKQFFWGNMLVRTTEMQFWPSRKSVCTEVLDKTSALSQKWHDFFKRNFLFREKFALETSEICQKFQPKTIHSQSKKSSGIFFFKATAFSQKAPLAYNVQFWHLSWIFWPNFQILKEIAQNP